MSDDEMEIDNPAESKQKVYVPGISRALKEGEELEFDPSAYHLFHSFDTEWPCLSFSVLQDGLGENRSTYPMEDDGSSSDDSDDEEVESEDPTAKEAQLHQVSIQHIGAVNRLKSQRLGDASVVAVWSDKAKVQIWNITEAASEAHAMTGKSADKKLKNQKPLFTFDGHRRQGYALAWNKNITGSLASGGQDGNIFLWKMREGGNWAVDQRALTAHDGSIEEVEWSPIEDSLLISAGVDQTIRLWDTRIPANTACVHTVKDAHASDVNVLSWNPKPTDPFIVSGGDDAELKIWSVQTIQYNSPVARFKHHTQPITSVEWHPTDSTTFIATSEDDQTSIWDLAVEPDNLSSDVVEGVPPQLLFLHCGQHELKEVHWHPQCPGVAITTAASGFNVIKPINC